LKNKIIGDLSYYKPINKNQEEFHASLAKHKLLLGGVGAGKTYPAIHESIFHMLENPGHKFYVFKNTWESMKASIEDEMISVMRSAKLFDEKDYMRDAHMVTLKNGLKCYFVPLTLKRSIIKGLNMCGYFIDDPDMNKYTDTVSYLPTRLRNVAGGAKATRFVSIITANWEGRNYLWKYYMKDRNPGGDEKYAYWILPTEENTELPEDFIENLAHTKSEDWMNRYVHMTNISQNIGIIYHMLDRKKHHVSYENMPVSAFTHNILSTDTGLGVTAVYNISTDRKAIYIWKESYKKGWLSSHLGLYLKSEKMKKRYLAMMIDPASAKKEQTSGTSVKEDLKKNFGINCEGADNSVIPGIRAVKDLLQPAVGPPRLFIDFDRCPELIKEMEVYRWKEPPDLDLDEIGYIETPIKKKDHGCDASRYGVQKIKRYLVKYLEVAKDFVDGGDRVESAESYLEKKAGMPFFKEHPDLLSGMRDKSVSPRERGGLPRKGGRRSVLRKKKIKWPGMV